MFETVRNAFKIKDLRKKILYTFFALIVVRIGCQLPVPGVDASVITDFFDSQKSLDFFNQLTGGSFSTMSIFALNITPYITASIIIQLLTIAIPKLEELHKDGEEGRKKLAEYTRYLTIALSVIESAAMAIGFGQQGYLTDGAKPIEFEITEDGKIVDLTGTDTSIYNQVKRGDLEGVKIGAGTHQRLAGVTFRITSKTTGESHIIVTDDNGQFSTSADWASHKHDTNEGKDSEDGVWFGTSEPDDTKGALLYDTYIIEELRCESNKGFELIPPFEIVVSRNNVTVDLGTLTDEYEKEITIHTTATGKDGEKSIVAGKEVTIVDTVTLDGLEKGTKYQLKGWQMLKEENAELLIDGQRVESDYTFTADSEEMKIEIEYTFNASSLGGQNLVTFEELYDLSNEDEPVKVTEHKDIDDEGQTVLITERIISIHTTATSEDGKKEIEAGKDVTIIDTVTLDGLEIGTKYQLVGWQMIKDENAELIIGGERVENDYTFTADSENMEVQIAFTFDASELGGKELVTFEELYDLSNPDEPTKVTEHKDIEDDGQTVTITEVPETPEEPTEPEQPTTPDTPTKTSDAPKTGDNTNIALFLGLLVLSGAGVAGTYFIKRRKRS